MRVAAGRSPSAAATDVRRSISALGSRTSTHGRPRGRHPRARHEPEALRRPPGEMPTLAGSTHLMRRMVYVGIASPGLRRAGDVPNRWSV